MKGEICEELLNQEHRSKHSRKLNVEQERIIDARDNLIAIKKRSRTKHIENPMNLGKNYMNKFEQNKKRKQKTNRRLPKQNRRKDHNNILTIISFFGDFERRRRYMNSIQRNAIEWRKENNKSKQNLNPRNWD